MTYCSTYIGDLEDPQFDPNAFRIGNIPRALSPAFPPVGHHYNRPFHDWVKLRLIPVKENDHSAYVAHVTKAQIVDYLETAYGSTPSYNDAAAMLMWNNEPYLVKKLNDIKVIVAQLSPIKLYALVAECD